MKSWSVDHFRLELDGEEIQNPWSGLNQLTGKGSIASLTIEQAHHLLLRHWRREDVDAVRVSIAFLHLECELFCEKNEEVKTLCSALALSQEWRIRTLYLPNHIDSAEVWEALSHVAGSGKVDTFIPVTFVKCKTAEEVITLSSALAFAKQWKIEELHLPKNIGAEGWEALCKVAVKGEVNIFCNGNIIAKKKEGDNNLQMLNEEEVNKKKEGDDDLQMLTQTSKKRCQLL